MFRRDLNIKILLGASAPHRCDLMAQDTCNGDTALHILARNGFCDSLALLFNCAEQWGVLKRLLNVRNRDGARPIDLTSSEPMREALASAHRRCDMQSNFTSADGT